MSIIVGHVDIFNAESNIIIAGFAPSMFYILLVITITLREQSQTEFIVKTTLLPKQISSGDYPSKQAQTNPPHQ